MDRIAILTCGRHVLLRGQETVCALVPVWTLRRRETTRSYRGIEHLFLGRTSWRLGITPSKLYSDIYDVTFITIFSAKSCVAPCNDCSISSQMRCALVPGHSTEAKAQWRCNWRPCASRRLQAAVSDEQHRWRSSELMRRNKLPTPAALIM
jgi:hypothetical protein